MRGAGTEQGGVGWDIKLFLGPDLSVLSRPQDCSLGLGLLNCIHCSVYIVPR
jgi:hypothetical protein